MDYHLPVQHLLTLGRFKWGDDWLDYRAMGIGQEHVSELIRMMTDPALIAGNGPDGELYAPIHAWRALAQMQALEAVEPLLQLVSDRHDDLGDLIWEEIPIALAAFGPAVLPRLQSYLADRTRPTRTRVVIPMTLVHLVKRNPEMREECVGNLMSQLETSSEEERDEELNTDLIHALLELKVKEAIPLVEKVYRTSPVDRYYLGDLEEVRYELEHGTPPPSETRVEVPIQPKSEPRQTRVEVPTPQKSETRQTRVEVPTQPKRGTPILETPRTRSQKRARARKNEKKRKK